MEEKELPQELNQEDIGSLWAQAMREQEEALKEGMHEGQERIIEEPKPAIKQDNISQEIQRLLDIPLNLEVVVGSTILPLGSLLQLGTGSVVELNKGLEDPVDILVNGKLIAKGGMVIVGEKFGVRITEIIGKEERIKNLST